MTEASWTSHPLKDDFPRSLLLAAIVLVVCGLAGAAMRSGIFACMGIAFFTVVLRAYLFPTRYRLTSDDLETSFLGSTRRRPWSEFSSFDVQKDGVYLASDRGGLFLRCKDPARAQTFLRSIFGIRHSEI